MAAGIITGALLVMIVLFVAVYPDSDSGLTRAEQTDLARTAAPDIIPSPETGRAPENPGDPGGWEQLLLLGLVVGGVAVVATLVWRSSRQPRRRAKPA